MFKIPDNVSHGSKEKKASNCEGVSSSQQNLPNLRSFNHPTDLKALEGM